jgi:DNA primase
MMSSSPDPSPVHRAGEVTAAGTVTSPRRDRLVEAHAAAARYYQEQLTGGAGTSPRRYLAERGLAWSINHHRWTVGYAPAGWTTLTDHLRRLTFADKELVTSGLSLKSRRGTLIDRFRDRVMLGIRNTDGELVGFIGRASPGTGHRVPKYLNSPQTPIFMKSSLLFGLGEQAERLRAGALPVLVEGPLDALAVDATNGPGLTRLVGISPCGTAFTPQHCVALAQIATGPILVAFDADGAGSAAAAAAYHVLNADFGPLHTAVFDHGYDPAGLLAIPDGRLKLRQALSATRPLATTVVEQALLPWARKLNNAEARVCALRSAVRQVGRLRTSDVAAQVQHLSRALDFPAQIVSEELTQVVAEGPAAREQREHRNLYPNTLQETRAPILSKLA